jgi:hypothetical protein
MSDKPSSPFAGLDKALLRPTRQAPPLEEQQDTQVSTDTPQAQMPENQQSGKLVSQKSRKPANKQSSKLEVQQASILEEQKASNRAHYPKVTYRLHPEVIDVIEDAKRLLRRRYNIKVSLEEIAEEAIRTACIELLENQQSSKLVKKFSGKPVNLKSRK